jgi:CheY-like chemotaxis protein
VSTADSERAAEAILLVEDEESVRFVLSKSLSRKGYRVVEALNGSEALEILDRGEPIDLMITDVVMPEIGGFELVSRVAREHPEVRVLFMSGYTQSDGGIDGHRLLDPGTHFLHKPFSTEALGEKVREILDE